MSFELINALAGKTYLPLSISHDFHKNSSTSFLRWYDGIVSGLVTDNPPTALAKTNASKVFLFSDKATSRRKVNFSV